MKTKKNRGKRFRTYTSDKQKKRDTEIATEIDATELRHLITRTKRLVPKNFRDLVIGGGDWLAMYKLLPKRRLAMDTWCDGKVLHYQALNESEIRVLGGKKKLLYYGYSSEKLTSFTKLYNLMSFAIDRKCSFIYMHDRTEVALVANMNKVCIHFDVPVRFKKELTYDNGTRVGEKD